LGLQNYEAGLTGIELSQGDAEGSRAEAGENPHLVAASGTARKVFDLIRAPAEASGFEIVRIRFGLADGHTLQIMAERADGSMRVEDCEELSKLLSALLDVEDPIPGEYNLEVSSAGIDRPLTRQKDFERWSGFEAKVEMRDMVAGRKRFRGILQGFEDDEVLLECELEGYTEPQVIGLPFAHLGEAKLVMNEMLIQESLKRRDPSGPASPDGE
jgi:ribosome maturation factor RimP